MKIAFSTLGCPLWDLQTVIERAVQYGYDGVDFRGLAGEMAVHKLPAFTSGAQRTIDMFRSAGLEISGFSSSARMFNVTPDSTAASLDEVAHYRELCERFGAKYIRVFGGNLADTPREQAIARAAATLDAMAKGAPGAVIVAETHDSWVDSSMLEQVMLRVTQPNIGVLWDLHHPYRLHGEQPELTYRHIGRFVRYVHVKDSRPTPGGYDYTLAGQGDVPLAEMIELLRAGGYDGWLTLEWEKLWRPTIAEPQEAFPSYATFLRQFISTVK